MFTKNFKELSKNDALIAGGKGASLGEMTQVGISVPPGFVVIADAFGKFLEETDLNVEIESILATVDIQKMHTVEKASEKIQGLILESKMPEDIKKEIQENFEKLGADFIAVRSSATAEDGADHAWAGQLNSYLNTTKENLLENIQKCWASLFTPRAIFYRFELLDKMSSREQMRTGTRNSTDKPEILVAVVVQKMIQSEKSGIAFSVHPVTEDYNQLIIEAGYGLGEAIVSGSITPDSYVVDKSRIRNSELRIKNEELRIERAIIDVNVNIQAKALYGKDNGGNEWRELGEKGKKQVLSNEEILELSDLIIKIENHYGFPCDIEWAYESGKFYITQSRPITTLKNIGKYTKSNALEIIKNNKFYNQITYSFIPVICFESTIRSYLNNPLQEKLGIKKFPIVIELLTNSFEGWDDQNIEKISDSKLIELVIKESRGVIKSHKKTIDNLLKIDFLKLNNDDFIYSIKSLDKICTEVYQCYIYFIHEFFETDNNKLIKLLPEVRMELSDFVSKIYEICDCFIEELAGRFNDIPWQTFNYATFDEIIGLLEDPESIVKFKKIINRPIVFVFDGVVMLTIKDKNEAQKIINALREQKEEVDEGVEKFNGIVAYKGRITGKVIKFSESDYKKINERIKDKNDYVLVVPMTRPEIVPYLKEVRAIVTDEGGIACHAAIVSRELKIPCIIGTKIATQVLKDGDLVEVDANEGVVKVLNNREEKNKSSKRMYKKIFNRYLPIYAAEYNYIGKTDAIKKITGGSANFPPLYINIPGRGNDVYYDEALYEESSRKAFEYFKNHPEEMQKISDDYKKVCEKNFDFVKNAKVKDIKKLFDLNANYISPMMTILILIGREEFDEEGSQVSRIARDIRYWNDRILYEVGMKIFELINKKFSWPQDSDNADYITIKEVLSNNPPSAEEIKKRKKSWVLLEGKKLYTGYKIEEFLLKNNIILKKEEKIKDIESINELKGNVAQKGIVKGKVKVVFTIDDLFKVEDGDIMVSSMTGPDFMLAIKKSAGIITDEGGITCHAAIVSRELKIPCIIGTKIATQVLKDGDFVEVDVERGIVKILKKAEADNEDRHLRDKKDKAKSRTEQSSGSGANEGVVKILKKNSN